jgi:hypothetical protein
VFVFPQGIPILANASDPDGTVSKVELLQGGTKLTECYVEPYAFFWTNAPVGTHQLTARATDNLGLMATSAPVNITILDHPPIAAGPIQLNRQNGLFEQSVTIGNPTPYAFTLVRLWIQNLTAETKVWNATGTNNGIPYIDYASPIAGGGSATFMVQYYIPSRIPPVPLLIPELLGTDYGNALLPPPAPRITSLVQLPDGAIALQFNASASTTYYVQYCHTLGSTWKTAATPILGTGALTEWVDDGPPNTESHPATQPYRFYRLVALPQ